MLTLVNIGQNYRLSMWQWCLQGIPSQSVRVISVFLNSNLVEEFSRTSLKPRVAKYFQLIFQVCYLTSPFLGFCSLVDFNCSQVQTYSRSHHHAICGTDTFHFTLMGIVHQISVSIKQPYKNTKMMVLNGLGMN